MGGQGLPLRVRAVQGRVFSSVRWTLVRNKRSAESRHLCTMMLHLMGTTLDKPSTVFKTLESIFRPESNQTLSRFKFHGLKQKQSQSCDGYMSELRLAIVECRYPDDVQDQLFKEWYIFSLYVKEIQDHLLGEITLEDTAEKCLLESRKIELKIEQRKLLSIKTSMTYDAIYRDRDRSRKHKE